MTKVQKIQIRLSECRQRLNELLAIEGRTAEQDTEMGALTKEVSAKEPELRAAIAAEPDDDSKTTPAGDPEERERLALARDSHVGAFIASAISGKPLEGREREVTDAYNRNGMLPWPSSTRHGRKSVPSLPE